jgi:hypothetical protein
MAERKRHPQLGADLIVHKGEAKPTTAPDSEPIASSSPLPKGTRNTIAITVRLDPERYKRLLSYGARFAPRRTNQDILVEALDAFLDTQSS